MDIKQLLTGQPSAPKPPKSEKTMKPDEKIKRYQNLIDLNTKYFEKNFWKRADRMVKFYELDHYYGHAADTMSDRVMDRIKVPYPYANTRQLLAQILVKMPEPLVKPAHIDPDSMPQPPQMMGAAPDLQALLGGGQPTDPSMAPNPTGLPPQGPPALPGMPSEAPPFTPTQTVPGMDGMPVQVDVQKGAETLKASLIYCRDKSNMKRMTRQMTLDAIVTGVGCVRITSVKDSKVPSYPRVVYRDVLWDHSVDSPYDSPWIAQRIRQPLEEAKQDERYDPKARASIQAASKIESSYAKDITDPYEQFTYATIWEFWNRKTDSHCMWSQGSTELLVEKTITEDYPFKLENSEFPVDAPYAFFIDEEMISEGWGMGNILPIESQVRENDKIRTYQIRHLARYNRKYGAVKGMLTEQGKNALQRGEDGSIVEFDSDDWLSKFQTIQDSPISGDFYNIGQTVENDIQLTSPVGPTALVSGVGQKPDTLGEAQIIQENTGTRLSEKQDQLSEVFRRIFRMTAQYIQTYWVEEDVLRIAGDGSRPTDWLHYSPEQVQGEYDYDVDPESFKDNTTIYRKQNAEALQIAAPILAQMNPPGIAIILKQYLSTFPTLERMIDEIVPEAATQPPPPMPPAVPPEEEQQGGDPHSELADFIRNTPEDQVVDTLKGLPDNERNAVLQAIQSLQQQPATPPA